MSLSKQENSLMCILHMERVIGLVTRKYQNLQSRAMPIEHMAVNAGDSQALIDKIGVICCVLSNLSDSVVPLEYPKIRDA